MQPFESSRWQKLQVPFDCDFCGMGLVGFRAVFLQLWNLGLRELARNFGRAGNGRSPHRGRDRRIECWQCPSSKDRYDRETLYQGDAAKHHYPIGAIPDRFESL